MDLQTLKKNIFYTLNTENNDVLCYRIFISNRENNIITFLVQKCVLSKDNINNCYHNLL